MKIRWFELLTVVTALAVIALVIQGRSAAANRDQGLRTFICYFENAVLKSPETKAQRHKTVVFFDGLLEKLHEPACPTPKETP